MSVWMAGGPLGGGGGVGVVSLSRDGALLLAAGAAGGVRVWDTRDWRWESWPSLGAPCVAAAWAGSAHGEAEAARTLLALAGEARLCAYRFRGATTRARLALRPRNHRPINLCTAAAAAAARRRRRPPRLGRRPRAWEAGGARASSVPSSPPPAGSSALCVLGARAFPSLRVHCVGWLRTPPATTPRSPRSAAPTPAAAPRCSRRRGPTAARGQLVPLRGP